VQCNSLRRRGISSASWSDTAEREAKIISESSPCLLDEQVTIKREVSLRGDVRVCACTCVPPFTAMGSFERTHMVFFFFSFSFDFDVVVTLINNVLPCWRARRCIEPLRCVEVYHNAYYTLKSKHRSSEQKRASTQKEGKQDESCLVLLNCKRKKEKQRCSMSQWGEFLLLCHTHTHIYTQKSVVLSAGNTPSIVSCSHSEGIVSESCLQEAGEREGQEIWRR
jgi:hypothetical protein